MICSCLQYITKHWVQENKMLSLKVSTWFKTNLNLTLILLWYRLECRLKEIPIQTLSESIMYQVSLSQLIKHIRWSNDSLIHQVSECVLSREASIQAHDPTSTLFSVLVRDTFWKRYLNKRVHLIYKVTTSCPLKINHLPLNEF